MKIIFGSTELGQFDLSESAEQQGPGKAGTLGLTGVQGVFGSQPVPQAELAGCQEKLTPEVVGLQAQSIFKGVDSPHQLPLLVEMDAAQEMVEGAGRR